MSRVQDTLLSFNAGALDKALAARSDLSVYKRGCKTLQNYIPSVLGGVSRRLGTHYLNDVKDYNNNVRLIPFRFNEIDSYVLELGNLYMRFYTVQTQVKDITGTIYEISTPYLDSELPEVKFRQIGDLVYLTHKNHPIYKLTRFGIASFTLTEVPILYGPVVDRDVNETVTMTVAGTIATGGTVTITASVATFGTNNLGFQANHIGSIWAFNDSTNSLSSYPQWTAGGASTANTYYRYNGNLYQAQSTGTFGTIPPIHLDGTDSDGSINLTYHNSGRGYAKMTGWTSSTVATFVVQRGLPPSMTTTATTYWNEGAWSSVRGYPRSLTFHEERLFLGGTTYDPVTIWGSRSGRRFEDFDTGSGLDTDAITYALSAENNTIEWLHSDGNFLLAGTAGGVGFIGSGNNQAALTATQVKSRTGAGFGGSLVQPVSLYGTVQYPLRQGTKINLISYDEISLNYKSEEISIYNNDILSGKVKEWSLMEEPETILFGVTEDGKLFSFTENIQQEVYAFASHTSSGATFESVCIISGTGNDEIWLVVNRGGVKSIEYIEPDDQNFLLDSATKFTNTGTLTGLYRFANQDITIVADGDVQTQTIDALGNVTLSQTYTTIYAGLNYNSDLSPMLMRPPSTANMDNGGVYAFISELKLLLDSTGSFKTGKDFNTLYPVVFNDGELQEVDFYQLFAVSYPDYKQIPFESNASYANIAIRQDLPLPCNILSITATIKGNRN